MNKIGVRAMVGLLAVVVLTLGATSASAKPKATVTLKFYQNAAYTNATNILVGNFERVFPEIDIEPTYLPSATLQPTLLTLLQAGTPPDMMYMSAGTSSPASIFTLAAAGRVIPLGTRPWAKRLKPLAEAITYKSKIYAWTGGVTPVAVWYNRDIFRQNGVSVPTTMAGVLAACKKLSAAGKIPIAYGMGSGNLSQQSSMIVDRFGQYLFGPDSNWIAKRKAGTKTFSTSPGARRALQSVVDMKEAGCFPPRAEGVSKVQLDAMVSSGQAAMYISNAALIQGFVAANPNLPLGVFVLPADEAKRTTLSYFISPNIGVSSSAPAANKAAAIKFLDFLGRPKQTLLFNRVANQVTAHEAAKGNVEPWAKPLVPYFKGAKPRTSGEEFGDVPNPAFRVQVAAAAFVGLFTGQMSVDQALKYMDDRWLP
jgi:raffinose/stachyose/melibiose transport system substrate-binding protein